MKITKKEIREIVQEALYEEEFLISESQYVDHAGGDVDLPDRQSFYRRAQSMRVNTSYSQGHHGQKNSSSWGDHRFPAEDTECFVAGSPKVVSNDGGRSFNTNPNYDANSEDYVDGMSQGNCPIVFQLPGQISFEYAIMGGAWYARSKRDHGNWRPVTSIDTRCMLDEIFLDGQGIQGSGACDQESAIATRSTYIRSDDDFADDTSKFETECEGLPAIRSAEWYKRAVRKVMRRLPVFVPLPEAAGGQPAGTGGQTGVSPYGYFGICWRQIQDLGALIYLANFGAVYSSLPERLQNEETRAAGGLCPATDEEWREIFETQTLRGAGVSGNSRSLPTSVTSYGVNSRVYENGPGDTPVDALQAFADFGTSDLFSNSQYDHLRRKRQEGTVAPGSKRQSRIRHVERQCKSIRYKLDSRACCLRKKSDSRNSSGSRTVIYSSSYRVRRRSGC